MDTNNSETTGYKVQVRVKSCGWIDHSQAFQTAGEAVEYIFNSDPDANIRHHNISNVRVFGNTENAVVWGATK